jgi:hypothetical protein
MALFGPVVELAYTSDLKSDARTGLRVRVPLGLPEYYLRSEIMSDIDRLDSDKLFTRIMIGLVAGTVIFVAFGL